MKEKDLVFIDNIWVRVLFIDNDNTAVGKIEIVSRYENTYKINEIVNFNINNVVYVYNQNDGKQWCYKDNITRCDCHGLCRNSC